MKRISLRLIALMGLMFIVSACAGLAGDVEIVATTEPQTASIPDSVSPPATVPDVLNGQRIFAENCTECHNDNGDGGGSLVQSGEVPRMPSFLEASHVREQTPAFYYDFITNGNIVNLMPPWADALSEEERWDVAMYVYTLHYDPAQVLQGSILYADAAEDFSLESDNALYSDIQASTELSDDEAWSATAYRRIRSVKNYGLLTGAEIDGLTNDAPPPEIMSFSGTLSNGTTGFDVPQNTIVELRYGNFADDFTSVSAPISAENTYLFENIPYNPAHFYFTYTTYQGVNYQSDLLIPADLQEANDLPITIYEKGENLRDITLENINIIVDRTNVDGMGSGMIFSQVYTFNNASDRTIHLTPPNQNISVSLPIQLPPGAIILNDNQNGRYIISEKDYLLIDTQPVLPGEHIVEAVYFLPHTSGEALIDLAMSTAFEGTLEVVLGVPSLSIESDVLNNTGEEVVIGVNGEAITVQNYSAEYSIPVGGNLIFSIAGSLFENQTTDEDASLVTGNSLIPILIIVIVIFLSVTFGLVMLRRRYANQSGDNQREVDRLLAQIAQLESLHDKGEINHDVFQRQRKELKEKLSTLMRQSATQDES